MKNEAFFSDLKTILFDLESCISTVAGGENKYILSVKKLKIILKMNKWDNVYKNRIKTLILFLKEQRGRGGVKLIL